MEIVRYGDKEAWLQIRGRDVTASDIAAICGLSPWATPLGVWARKKKLIAVEETPLMARGRWFEAAAITALREQHPDWDIRRASVYVRDPALRMGCTPDFLCEAADRPGQMGNIQVKTVSVEAFNREWRRADGEIEAPVHVQLQTLMEAKLVEADWCAALAMVVGSYSGFIALAPVAMDETAWQRMVEEARQFLWYLDNNREPPLILWRDAENLKAMYPAPRDAAAEVDLSQHNQLPELLAEREALAEQIKASKERMGEIETEVMDLMKDNAFGRLPGWSIKWRIEPRKGYTVAPSEPRVLRITKQKEKR